MVSNVLNLSKVVSLCIRKTVALYMTWYIKTLLFNSNLRWGANYPCSEVVLINICLLGCYRSSNDSGTALAIKSSKRKELEAQGYNILGNMGDQWSDILGNNAGQRTFKLPDPMYYISWIKISVSWLLHLLSQSFVLLNLK